MFNYHGLKVVLPTDNPEMIADYAKRHPKEEFINAQFAYKEIPMKDKEGKVVKTNKSYYMADYPNREAKRRSERNHMRKNSKGIPIGFSSLEFGRYQNRFNKVKTKEPSVDISDFSSAANSDRNLSNNE